MPILNAAYSTWDIAGLSIPIGVGANGKMAWSNKKDFVINNFRSQQTASLEYDTETKTGIPDGTTWQVGDDIWQIDFSTPFLVPKDFDPTIDDHSLFCANLPRINGSAYPIVKYIDAVMLNYTGITPADTTPDMTDIHDLNGEDSSSDIIVQKIQVEVNEQQATLNVTLMSTKDPRSWFTPVPIDTGMAWTGEQERKWRMAKPWDFQIPANTPSVLGSPGIEYDGGRRNVPTRTLATGEAHYDLMIRGLNITVENRLQNFRSVGMTSARPFMGVSMKTVTGSLQGIPIYWDGGARSGITSEYPGGWMPDVQMLEEIERSGGQLYVTGQPPYVTGEENSRSPLYVQIGLRNGTSTSPYEVIAKDTLGPIGIATASMQQRGGAENEVSLEFRTLVGITENELTNDLIRS